MEVSANRFRANLHRCETMPTKSKKVLTFTLQAHASNERLHPWAKSVLNQWLFGEHCDSFPKCATHMQAFTPEWCST
jgi:hypothetical protein